ncbi:phosphate signaling complex protein PhoU [Alicyclobacillus cycloheptanicus]|uniref:Phosphate-specific transport system accessory protein PhoU n=1 Tax=Alicyclobacillus cycloheptanicus TaxID=1457 RepID=A0ABT9XL35_9BACL|nr:phosphate signaling complex protein PhoU [Alicyclobacillus cycloheptanicus]MDQ0191024.1 phosphate transport system protein [Alicyclobacillus cycloheptanicus]WDM00916.1 phosphate signaling complex protein PhoU [Alicyclobacillus cycloheptanicus]
MQQRQTFDIALRELKLKLLHMGGDVQEAMRNAVESLKNVDRAAAQQVVDGDRRINRQENEIEDLCIRLIATQQPVATDLRKIVAGMRIASDLERMGDLAVDVAKSTLRLEGQRLMKPLVDIPRMSAIIDEMISDALNAYVENSTDLANKLASSDDQVDRIYRKIVEELFAASKEHPQVISQAMTLAFVGRYLERIGDHATNIGESVIYIVTGERSDLN